MKYSLLDGESKETQPGLTGICKYCNRPTIAKCGDVKIWHWAHKGKRICDPWWENETEWHRSWKGQFPENCQEIIHYAENGEKHIADVKVDNNYVIEFQHSYLKPEERQARESFYKKMLWVVDGTRRLKDKNNFVEVWKNSALVGNKLEWRRLYFTEGALLRDWGNSNVPVFFDFAEDLLFGILPKTRQGRVYAFRFERNELIASLHPAMQGHGFETRLKNWMNLITSDENHLQWQTLNSAPNLSHTFQKKRNLSFRL